MTWGMPDQVVDRFVAAGVADDSISFERDTFVLEQDMGASDFLLTFRQYFGPTMSAFEAAEVNGRADELLTELDDLFNEPNTSTDVGRFSFPAAYLRVTVDI